MMTSISQFALASVIFFSFGAPTAFCTSLDGINPKDQPKVIKLIPANGSSVPPVAVRELKIMFNVDMNTKNFSVSTPCKDSGVCYKNGFWLDNRTLVIRVDRRLKPNYKYELGIGTKTTMTSAEGLHLEPVWWRFDTLM